jgi:cell division protein FtsI/penicillin-binding protein 2
VSRIAIGVALLAVVLISPDGGRRVAAEAEVRVAPEALPESVDEDSIRPVEARPAPWHGLDLNNLVERGGRLVQDVDGQTLVTTLDPELQRFAVELLASFEVPDGAAVAINSRTGEVLALAEHSERSPGRHVALEPEPPAASIFKIVTAAALLEIAGLSPDTETCYHGGADGITVDLLDPDAALDRSCASLSLALGRSINVIFARLADEHLSAEQLDDAARAFGFNVPIPFEIGLAPSTAVVPAERLERARMAAGFWHSNLSPIQAAVMAQAVAQDGAMLRPYLVDEVRDASGDVVYDGQPQFLWRACSAETARALARMMVVTTSVGTARSSFRDRDGRPVIRGIDVSGKTGTLHGRSPFRAYDWFMGFAPATNPEIAVAGLVINDPEWRIKGHYVGRELLRRYFQLHPHRPGQSASSPEP